MQEHGTKHTDPRHMGEGPKAGLLSNASLTYCEEIGSIKLCQMFIHTPRIQVADSGMRKQPDHSRRGTEEGVGWGCDCDAVYGLSRR
jgi:hypothetical protein